MRDKEDDSSNHVYKEHSELPLLQEDQGKNKEQKNQILYCALADSVSFITILLLDN